MSDDSILTDPTRQSLDLRQEPYQSIPLAGGAWTQIADPDPQRLSLTAVSVSLDMRLIIAPAPVGSPTDAVASQTPAVQVYHAAAYPLLIIGQWWAWSSGVQTLYVWDVTREQ